MNGSARPSDGPGPAELRRVPPHMAAAVLGRGEWSLCALEHSRLGPMRLEDPGAPFHHLAVALERVPIRFESRVDGVPRTTRNAPGAVTMIEAGVGGMTAWDTPYEAACLYFTDRALSEVLGTDARVRHEVRTGTVDAPDLVRLVHALHGDAAAGQPHGTLVGDAVFVALAARLVPDGTAQRRTRSGSESWRVRRALEAIHADLTGPLDLRSIAAAAETSPYHLTRIFRAALGRSVWQYVLRERARYAMVLMRDPRRGLADVAQAAGFDTYASFIDAVRRESGHAPSRLRRALARS